MHGVGAWVRERAWRGSQGSGVVECPAGGSGVLGACARTVVLQCPRQGGGSELGVSARAVGARAVAWRSVPWAAVACLGAEALAWQPAAQGTVACLGASAVACFSAPPGPTCKE